MLKLFNIVKNIIEKSKDFINSGTIDAEHYLIMFYSVGWLLPLLLNRIGCIILLFVAPIFGGLLWGFLISSLLCIINGFIFNIVRKSFLSYLKSKRIVLTFITFYLIFAFLTSALLWLGWSMLHIKIALNYITQSYDTAKNIIQQTGKYRALNSDIQNVFGDIAKLGSTIIAITAISLILSTILPTKYQVVDIPWRYKLNRILIKIFLIIIPLVILLLFSAINKSTFAIVGTVVVIITWLINPVHRASLFISDRKISEDDFLPRVINSSKIYQLILGGIVTSLGISVYFFENVDWMNRFWISSIIFIGFILLIIIYRCIVERNKNDWIKKNFKRDVAVELIQLEERNKDK